MYRKVKTITHSYLISFKIVGIGLLKLSIDESLNMKHCKILINLYLLQSITTKKGGVYQILRYITLKK